jgi:hypothetical protein
MPATTRMIGHEVVKGVFIDLTGDELATAIDAYLVAHSINIIGPRTISVNGERCESARIYADPSSKVINNGELV